MHDVRFVPLIFNIDKVSDWFDLASWKGLIKQSWEKKDIKELVVFRQIFFGLVLTKVKRNSMSEETKQLSESLIEIFQKCTKITNIDSLIQEVEDIHKNNEAFINTKQDKNLSYEREVIEKIIEHLKLKRSIQDIYKYLNSLKVKLAKEIINSSHVADFITNYIDFDFCFSIKKFKDIEFVNSNIKLNVFIVNFIFSYQRITNTPLLQKSQNSNTNLSEQEQEIEQILNFQPANYNLIWKRICYQHTYAFIYYSLIMAHLEKFDYSHMLVEDNDKHVSVANSNTPHTSEENPNIQAKTAGSNSNNDSSSPTKKRRIQ